MAVALLSLPPVRCEILGNLATLPFVFPAAATLAFTNSLLSGKETWINCTCSEVGSGLVRMTSNRHWPNLFKSKPSTSQHQWHQMTTSSNISGPNLSSNEGTSSREEEREREKEKEKERNPDPKLRWNPKPEQIRILESIFNSGMVNPPREEIQKIRMQLEEYGQVGDASVSYWFHNRKSRTKQKQRHLQASAEKSSKSSATGQSCFDQYGVTLPNNNTSSFIGELPSSLLPCSASFPMQYLGYQQTEGINTAQYLNMEVAQMWNEGTSCTGNIHGMSNIPQNQQTYSSFLHNEGQAYPPYVDHHAAAETFKPHQNLLSPPLNDSTIIHSGAESRVSSSNASSFTVFINDIPIDVPMGPINNNTNSFIGELPSSLLPCSASFPMQYLGYQQTEGINTAQYLNMEVAQMWNEGTSCTGNIHGMSNIPQNQQTYSSFLHNEGQAYPPYVDHHAGAETFKPHQNLLSPPLNDSTIIHSGAGMQRFSYADSRNEIYS
ncbi:WUSCHEL-related homeobox 8-like [Cryptomeria japonica]|uniref:WUSCHEL-related homeobox 8-like n=1 Tax=Cryptomeria japonica TaxID=3369 RepID=UPI0027DA9403|nr:WUSCHEL-related homeobox 8-like [Cryptomeria japonica]